MKIRHAPLALIAPLSLSLVAIVCVNACKARTFHAGSSAKAIEPPAWRLPELLTLPGEWDACQPAIARDFLKVKNALAGTAGGLADICEQPDPALGTLAARSPKAERERIVFPFDLKQIVAAPGQTHLREPDTVKRYALKLRTGGIDKETVINIVTDAGTDDGRAGRIVSVDAWAGHDILVAAIEAGIGTLGELKAKAPVKLLLNGRTSDAGETWPHVLDAASAPITLDLRSEFSLNRSTGAGLQYEPTLSNHRLGSRMTIKALHRTLSAKPKRVTYFIGTMNPPHIGHLRQSLYGLESLGTSEAVVFVNDAGHKPDAQHLFHRLNMTALFVREQPGLNMVNGSYSTFERDFGLDALERRIANVYGTSDVWALVGGDAYVRDIVKNNGGNLRSPTTKLFVFPRKGEDEGANTVKPGLENRIKVIDVADTLGMSSTLMRNKLAASEPIDTAIMSQAVQDYIEKWCLYKPEGAPCAAKAAALSQLESVSDASALHRAGSLADRLGVIGSVKISRLVAPPGRAQLPALPKLPTGKKIVVNILTMENPPDAAGKKEVIVRTVEVLSGTEALASGLDASCTGAMGWKTISDIPVSQIDVRVNGIAVDGSKPGRVVALACARDSRFPAGAWADAGTDAEFGGRVAKMDAGIAATDVRFSEPCRGRAMLDLVAASFAPTGRKYACSHDAPVGDDE